MKKLVFAAITCLLFSASSAFGQVDVFYSTSADNANEGTTLDMLEGETNSMYLWVTNSEDSKITGMTVDMLSSDAEVLEATSFTFSDPGSWDGTNLAGGLGDLVFDARAIAVLASGIAPGETALFGEIQFQATSIGTTDLTIAETDPITVASGVPAGGVNFGTATVIVNAAIPEPSALSFGVLGIAGLGFVRRRKN